MCVHSGLVRAHGEQSRLAVMVANVILGAFGLARRATLGALGRRLSRMLGKTLVCRHMNGARTHARCAVLRTE